MLELKNISFSAEDNGSNIEIIRNISHTIGDNKFVVITGPNGGGKSTLAKIIAGIVPNTGGQIIFDGVDITEKNITERAKLGIGFAFQQPVRFKGLTVIDLLRIAAGKDYIDREINASLSGGELKRIEIATVLARDVKLAIFDEPEAGIDLWSFNNLIRIFEKMRQERHGRTILVISHQERILNIADEIIVISDGNILKHGDKDIILPEITGTENAINICHKMA